MIIGKKYNKANLKEFYDSIIIGSGLGGLTTAAFLAKNGQRVLGLERHYTAGGFTHVYKRAGFEWDVGLHYIGKVHDPKSPLRLIFDEITDGKLDWKKMGPVYDNIIIGDEEFSFVEGLSNFKSKMIEYFPKEKSAINEYISLVKKVNSSSRSYFMKKALPKWLRFLLSPFMGRTFLKYAKKTTKEVLNELTNNEKLIGVLTGQWGDYGLPPGRSPFSIHAMISNHYFDGGNYPIGGGSKIAETIVSVIEKNGGEVITNAPVKEILVEKERVQGVLLENGVKIFSDRVISNAGIKNTYHLLPPHCVKKEGLKSVLTELKSSMGHYCLYIGLEGNTEELQLKTTNQWIYKSEFHDENIDSFLEKPVGEFPLVYISFPSAKDPSWDKRYPGKSTIEMITLSDYDWFSKWEGTDWHKRGDDYNSLKEEVSQRLLNVLFKKFPNLKKKVTFYELSTPLSTKHFSNYQKGELYGLDHTFSRFQSDISTRGPVKNLFLTGQDVVTCGIGGVLMAGALTSISVLGYLKSRDIIKLMMPKKKR